VLTLVGMMLRMSTMRMRMRMRMRVAGGKIAIEEIEKEVRMELMRMR
jgi:hypothetical protein